MHKARTVTPVLPTLQPTQWLHPGEICTVAAVAATTYPTTYCGRISFSFRTPFARHHILATIRVQLCLFRTNCPSVGCPTNAEKNFPTRIVRLYSPPRQEGYLAPSTQLKWLPLKVKKRHSVYSALKHSRGQRSAY